MGYTGHRHNNLGSGATDIGLIYMNARWYLPGLGRFITADTLVPNPTDPQSWNRYSYTNNNPLRYTDPTGHWLETVWDIANVVMGAASFADNVSQGNYGAAAVDALGVIVDVGAAVIPVVPGGVGTLIKGARAAENVADVVQAVNRVDNVADAAQAVSRVDEVAGAAGDMASSYAARYTDDVVGATCSFSAETEVLTQAGLEAISEVTLDELVWAFNEETGEMGWYPVVAVWSHEDPITVYLTIEGEVIETTPEHPFKTVEDEWLPAAALQAGDEIRNAEWAAGTVEAIEFVAESQTMYNFTVATAHTYFVGEGQWLVHNACPLRNNIGAQPGEQAHHLIPNELQSHDFVKQATAGGWSQHAGYNGMALPDNAAAAVNGPYHNGPHRNYTQTVRGHLNQLQTQNLSPSQAFQELQNLAGQMKTHINNLPSGSRIN